jgi:transcriptional regulator with XRE-family HTH domain
MATLNVRLLVGRNLRRLRAAARLTQEALSEKTGISVVYISGIERGQRNPSVVVMFELAQALGADVRDLLDPVSCRL